MEPMKKQIAEAVNKVTATMDNAEQAQFLAYCEGVSFAAAIYKAKQESRTAEPLGA